MALPTTYPGAGATGKNAAARFHVEPPESLGKVSDSRATSVSAENSVFALLKGMAHGLGVTGGPADPVVNPEPDLYGDPLVTLGERSDAAATATGRHSAISLLKGILAVAGI